MIKNVTIWITNGDVFYLKGHKPFKAGNCGVQFDGIRASRSFGLGYTGQAGEAGRQVANRVQLTTDGHKAYLTAVGNAFGTEVDYAMLVKIYGEGEKTEARYSPAQYMGTRIAVITGSPDHSHISTSYVERHNLTIRMGNRRFTRLTNAFSKKVENHEHMLALFFCYYNFCKIHTTLRCTPAMEAKVSSRVWEISDLVALIDSESSAEAAA